MDVELPNGTLLEGVPDNTPKQVIMEKAINGGYASQEDFMSEVTASLVEQNNKEFDTSTPLATPEPMSQEPEFVDRINNPQSYDVINNADGSFSTHRMRAERDAKGKWYVFPDIQLIDGKLQELSGDESFNKALETGNFISMPNKASAIAYTETYKQDTPLPAFAMKRSIANHQLYDQGYIEALSMIESTNRPNAESTSGALGLYQFLEKTWRNTVKEYAPKLYKSYSEEKLQDLRRDPEISRYMADMLTRENAANMQKRGAKPTRDALYLAHFLGVGEASTVVTAVPNTPIKDAVSAKTIKNNPNVFKNIKTTGDLIRWSDAKVKEHAPQL